MDLFEHAYEYRCRWGHGNSEHWAGTCIECREAGRHGVAVQVEPATNTGAVGLREAWAVGLREAVRALGSAWRANDDEAASSALARLEDTVGLREQGDPTPAQDAVERSGALMEIRYAGRAVYAFQEDAEWLAQRLADDDKDAD